MVRLMMYYCILRASPSCMHDRTLIISTNYSEWKDGLVPRILRKHAQQLKTSELFSGMKPTPFAKWIHFDGIVSQWSTHCIFKFGWTYSTYYRVI